jgi:phosphohistidine phosphatase
MHLLIIRHAIALPRGTPGMADPDRPLTAQGEKKFKKAAKGLTRLIGRPDAILTSPWVRARRTAEIAAAAWRAKEPKDTPALTGGDVAALEKALSGYGKKSTVAVVGHEPWLSALLAHLLGTGKDDRLVFRKGGAALVELNASLADGGTLLWFLPPGVLRELA